MTALLGVGLAVHGYGHGLVVSGTTGPLGRAEANAAAPLGAKARGSSTTTAASSSPKTTLKHPSRPPTTVTGRARSAGTSSGTSSSTGQKLGPPLSSTPYAAYAYQIYPGPETSQAQLATAGFAIKVSVSQGHITVSAQANGSSGPPQVTTYPAGDRVYFIEASFGDDSGNADYSYGDDGLVVTNSKGQIVE
ncbi:MAG: hypothetical protein ACP5VR_02010 [Acidimicrobiales bacterium]